MQPKEPSWNSEDQAWDVGETDRHFFQIAPGLDGYYVRKRRKTVDPDQPWEGLWLYLDYSIALLAVLNWDGNGDPPSHQLRII